MCCAYFSVSSSHFSFQITALTLDSQSTRFPAWMAEHFCRRLNDLPLQYENPVFVARYICCLNRRRQKFVKQLFLFLFRYSSSNETCSNCPDYFNSLWFISVTFFSLGYGDVVPVTYCGRIIAICAGIMVTYIQNINLINITKFYCALFPHKFHGHHWSMGSIDWSPFSKRDLWSHAVPYYKVSSFIAPGGYMIFCSRFRGYMRRGYIREGLYTREFPDGGYIRNFLLYRGLSRL